MTEDACLRCGYLLVETMTVLEGVPFCRACVERVHEAGRGTGLEGAQGISPGWLLLRLPLLVIGVMGAFLVGLLAIELADVALRVIGIHGGERGIASIAVGLLAGVGYTWRVSLGILRAPASRQADRWWKLLLQDAVFRSAWNARRLRRIHYVHGGREGERVRAPEWRLMVEGPGGLIILGPDGEVERLPAGLMESIGTVRWPRWLSPRRAVRLVMRDGERHLVAFRGAGEAGAARGLAERLASR